MTSVYCLIQSYSLKHWLISSELYQNELIMCCRVYYLYSIDHVQSIDHIQYYYPLFQWPHPILSIDYYHWPHPILLSIVRLTTSNIIHFSIDHIQYYYPLFHWPHPVLLSIVPLTTSNINIHCTIAHIQYYYPLYHCPHPILFIDHSLSHRDDNVSELDKKRGEVEQWLKGLTKHNEVRWMSVLSHWRVYRGGEVWEVLSTVIDREITLYIYK